jgi:hypothetical protein
MNTDLRKSRLFKGIDFTISRSLEIGPLNVPILSKLDTNVLYCDYLDRSELVKKYKNIPEIEIQEVDYVVDGKLSDTIRLHNHFNYFIASHVIEHVPDLIGWLKELEKLGVDNCKVFLVVPDKRFTFDFYRKVSKMSEILSASVLHSQRPSVHQIIDDLLYASHVNIEDAWEKGDELQPVRVHSLNSVLEIASNAVTSNEYVDSHCWVFTPDSFKEIFHDLYCSNFTNFKLTYLLETERNEFEFYAILEKTTRD